LLIVIGRGDRERRVHANILAPVLREKAGALPVTFEPVPNDAFIKEGIEADTLGVFTGPAFADQEHSASPLPPQIILFLDNLWRLAEGDEQIFLDEVHTTYLHELGHYLGLDEDDLFERGLD
jgi:predicted Zn-dependent protease with MMP-like domain